MKRAGKRFDVPGRGFTLIEILVALVVFAAMSAIAWGALSQVAKTRGALAAEQDRFAAIVRTMGDLERDLRQAISRPLRGNYAEPVPALLGFPDRIELSRLGFANPRSEPRSNIERVSYAVSEETLRRGRYAVLDRAAGSAPQWSDQLEGIQSLRFRYLGGQGDWNDRWPPQDAPPGSAELPRAVEFRITLEEWGELRRVIALPASMPQQGVGTDGGVAPQAPLSVPGSLPVLDGSGT
ncbi:type II secretion system minor pseudopilin GspJ [Dokdonella sp.]|uniref:type II secretion system minor pseudopilin GspJ n=1 Tax=Dokdonella sp. TaxID=2291710 RepID=UPI0035277B5F